MRGLHSVILLVFIFILFIFSSYACNNDGFCDDGEDEEPWCDCAGPA